VLRNTVIQLNDENSDAPRLRAYDWAVTNYAKGHPTVLLVQSQDGSSAIMDPNMSYEGELRKHHRLLFDPFRRGTHIFFEIDGLIHRSTVGQLTFIKWCIENMSSKKGNNFPRLEISYYKHKKNAGVYYSHNKMIRIHVNTHNNVLELTDTIIHEYQHHLDMPTQKQQKEYNELTAKNGYWNNPYEIKARESGLKLRDACAKELFIKGFLVII
jgi:hypothetical protein